MGYEGSGEGEGGGTGVVCKIKSKVFLNKKYLKFLGLENTCITID